MKYPRDIFLHQIDGQLTLNGLNGFFAFIPQVRFPQDELVYTLPSYKPPFTPKLQTCLLDG